MTYEKCGLGQISRRRSATVGDQAKRTVGIRDYGSQSPSIAEHLLQL